MRKTKTSGNGTVVRLEQRIIELLRQPDYTPLNSHELARRLGLGEAARRNLERTLQEMERRGQVARLKQGNRFGLPLEADLVPGRIRMNRRGIGLLQPSVAGIPAIRIEPDATSTALHGDRVLVRRDPVPRAKDQIRGPASGRVVRILERARTRLVGTLQRGRQFLYVVPDDPRIVQDIYVPEPGDMGRPARIGDKVVVELREWASRHTNPEGEIIEVLGAPDAEGVDMLSVIRQYNLPLHFSKRVVRRRSGFGQEVESGGIAPGARIAASTRS